MRVPIFRTGRFKNGAIKEMVPGGIITEQHIAEIATNTGRQMRETSWKPRVKHNHGGDRPTIGWIETPPEARGRLLVADLDLNDDGKTLVKSKRARFLSSEIDTGRSLHGDEDSERLGLRLDAVALLSGDDPQIKNLVDLFAESAADFSEVAYGGNRIIRDTLYSNESGHVAYFAEIQMSGSTSPDDQYAEFREENARERRFAKAALADAGVTSLAEFNEGANHNGQAFNRAFELYSDRYPGKTVSQCVEDLGRALTPQATKPSVSRADFSAAGDAAASQRVYALFEYFQETEPWLSKADVWAKVEQEVR